MAYAVRLVHMKDKLELQDPRNCLKFIGFTGLGVQIVLSCCYLPYVAPIAP